jgi:hypothetical protein
MQAFEDERGPMLPQLGVPLYPVDHFLSENRHCRLRLSPAAVSAPPAQEGECTAGGPAGGMSGPCPSGSPHRTAIEP